MEKIYQLKDFEYNKLTELAELNEKSIEERALKLYQEKGTYQLDIKINCEKYDDYNRTYHLKAYSKINDWNQKFPIFEEDKRKIIKFVNEKVMSMMVNRFGDVVNNVNLINKRVDDAITLKR